MVTWVKPIPGIPGCGRVGELEASGRPRSAPATHRGEVDGVLPRVPRRFVVGSYALGVDDEQASGAQLDGITPPAAIQRLMTSCASAGE